MSLFMVTFLAASAAMAGMPDAGDIESFWRGTLARVPVDAEVAKAREPAPYSSYVVTLHSLDGVRIRDTSCVDFYNLSWSWLGRQLLGRAP